MIPQVVQATGTVPTVRSRKRTWMTGTEVGAEVRLVCQREQSRSYQSTPNFKNGRDSYTTDTDVHKSQFEASSLKSNATAQIPINTIGKHIGKIMFQYVSEGIVGT